MTNHPNRSRLGDLSTLESVKSYVSRLIDNSDESLSLADVIEEYLHEDDKIIGFEVEDRTVTKYSTDSGHYERDDICAKAGDFVHMRAVVAVVDLGAYGHSRNPVAYFEARAGKAERMAARLNKELA